MNTNMNTNMKIDKFYIIHGTLKYILTEDDNMY